MSAASLVLLLTDLRNRRGPEHDIPHVAVMQYASSQLMEEGTEGALAALHDAGFHQDENIRIRVFNPEGDMPTANAIASEIEGDHYDLVITMGTPAMQAMANANKSGSVVHVFGLVADPPSAGVGISRDDPMIHPAHLVGVGSFLPVAPVFELLRALNPDVRSVGLVWNAAESNSEAFTVAAREVCAKLDIELLEANADNSNAVAEAASSLVARGAEALWISGDNTVAVASHSIVSAAKASGIPSFSILTGNAEQGSLFELGADFTEIGRKTGDMAASILRGADPSSIPWADIVPPMLVVNKTALDGLGVGWSLPATVLERAEGIIDADGLHMRDTGVDRELSKTWKVKAYSYIESPAAEECLEGVYQGLEESGLVQGRDYEISFVSAQGDIATASTIIDAAVTEGSDLMISLSTPMLQASIARAGDTPVVFTLVADPVLAGAGESNTNHLPNFTGNFVVSPFAELVDVVVELMPEARRVGTLFSPGEVNSVICKDLLKAELDRVGIELVTVGVNSSAEATDAALSLGTAGLDAIVQIADNLLSAAFTAIVGAAERFDLPLFSCDGSQAGRGPVLILSRDYRDGGFEAGQLAAEVMRGADPADMPFQPVEKVNFIIDLHRARTVGLEIPETILQRADLVMGR